MAGGSATSTAAPCSGLQQRAAKAGISDSSAPAQHGCHRCAAPIPAQTYIGSAGTTARRASTRKTNMAATFRTSAHHSPNPQPRQPSSLEYQTGDCYMTRSEWPSANSVATADCTSIDPCPSVPIRAHPCPSVPVGRFPSRLRSAENPGGVVTYPPRAAAAPKNYHHERADSYWRSSPPATSPRRRRRGPALRAAAWPRAGSSRWR